MGSCRRCVDRTQLRPDKPKAAPLQAAQNLPDEPALDRVGLADHERCLLAVHEREMLAGPSGRPGMGCGTQSRRPGRERAAGFANHVKRTCHQDHPILARLADGDVECVSN